MRHRFPALLALFPFAVLATVACVDLDSPADEEIANTIAVTGDIENNSGQEIPANARVLVSWGVPTGDPSYNYVFGEGTLDAAAGTFRITLSEPPPEEAINAGIIGVGIVIVTTDQEVGTGDDLHALSEGIIGAAPRYALVWREPGVTGGLAWLDAFDSGYDVGIGEDVDGDFDTFSPSLRNEMILIIDDPANLDFVDWS